MTHPTLLLLDERWPTLRDLCDADLSTLTHAELDAPHSALLCAAWLWQRQPLFVLQLCPDVLGAQTPSSALAVVLSSWFNILRMGGSRMPADEQRWQDMTILQRRDLATLLVDTGFHAALLAYLQQTSVTHIIEAEVAEWYRIVQCEGRPWAALAVLLKESLLEDDPDHTEYKRLTRLDAITIDFLLAQLLTALFCHVPCREELLLFLLSFTCDTVRHATLGTACLLSLGVLLATATADPTDMLVRPTMSPLFLTPTSKTPRSRGEPWAESRHALVDRLQRAMPHVSCVYVTRCIWTEPAGARLRRLWGKHGPPSR